MRYLRLAAICIFVLSLGFSAWSNIHYYSDSNTDIPSIESNTELLEISVTEGREALLQGLTAHDETDGDLTDRIMVASVSHFMEKGLVNVKYVVFDKHHNAGSITRQVRYTDYESPKFSLSTPAVFTRGADFNLLDRVKVEDCIDGDISRQIRVITNMVNSFAAGVYPVTLEVTNSCGDLAQLTLWVTVLDKENSASITLSQYIVYVEQGTRFDPYSYIRSVTDANNLSLPKENVQVKGTLDMNTPGSYRLEYTYSDSETVGQTAITVVVEGKEGVA